MLKHLQFISVHLPEFGLLFDGVDEELPAATVTFVAHDLGKQLLPVHDPLLPRDTLRLP